MAVKSGAERGLLVVRENGSKCKVATNWEKFSNIDFGWSLVAILVLL